ncbi:MAG: hypothetical protein WD512_05900 [Candidatus Paceibacterota bacterium]
MSNSEDSPEYLERILKDRYQSELTRKDTIDTKANNMMTIASTIAGLYSGFGAVLATDFFKIELEWSIPTIILIGGIFVLIISIIISTRAYILKEYRYAFNFFQLGTQKKEHAYKIKLLKLFKHEKNSTEIDFNNTKISEYFKRDITNFRQLMCKIYTKSIILNYDLNNTRATFLIWSQIFFLIGIFTFPVFIIAIIIK